MQPDLYRTCISASFFPPSVLLDYNTLADDICPCYNHHGQPLYNPTAQWAIFFFSPSVFPDWCQVIGWAPITSFVSRTTKRKHQSWKTPTGSSIQWNPPVSGPQGSNKVVVKLGHGHLFLLLLFFFPLWEWLNWSASTMAGYEALAIWQEKAGYETQWVTW